MRLVGWAKGPPFGRAVVAPYVAFDAISKTWEGLQSSPDPADCPGSFAAHLVNPMRWPSPSREGPLDRDFFFSSAAQK